jgi:ATP-dependent DNA helicase RecG
MKKDKLNFMLKEGESFNLEFKEKDKDLGKEICAFANANGGRIILGISDRKEIKGIKITNRLKSQITDIARNFDPKLEVTFEEIDDVLLINVPEGSNKPYSVSGKFYLRIGPNSQQLSRDEIRDFFFKEGLILWDEKENQNFDLEKNFSKEAFKNFIQKANLSNVLSKKEILQNLSLLKNNHLKNAGVLLFAKDITKFFLKGIITCVLYEGTDKVNILDKKDFTKDLYSNYLDAFNYLKSKLNTQIIITSGPHEKKLELPERALREALVNAIGHRDYNVNGGKILVEISLDRVEITNPGGLVKGLKKEEFGKKSLSRNNLLFGLLQRINLVENIGSGIRRMRDEMKAYGYKGPDFEISDDWFVIIFRRKAQATGGVSGGVSGGVNSLFNYIKNNPGLRVVNFAKTLNVPTRTIERWIKQLKEEGKIEFKGSPKKGGYWEVEVLG